MFSTPMPPANAPIAITPDDDDVIDPPLMGFYVEIAGDVTVVGIDGVTTGVYTDALQGVQYAQQCTKIMATGTTATVKGLR